MKLRTAYKVIYSDRHYKNSTMVKAWQQIRKHKKCNFEHKRWYKATKILWDSLSTTDILPDAEW